jgi:Fur family ferric uptake transcriptional regulator
MSDIKENLIRQLRENGNKITPQRQAVIDAISENSASHLSTEEIYRKVKESFPDIGLATVYRTLLLFVKLGIVNKLNFDDGFNRYELSDDEDHRHHHLICIGCGSVTSVEEDLLENLENQLSTEYDFQIVDHRVKFYGYCSKCKTRHEGD